jgi:N-acetylmuramoyl-L-alanine amidase
VNQTHPSPNFGDRRGKRVDLIVLHYTAMASAAEVLARLCDPGPEVSAHYLIDRDGTVFALVDETMRAWHAGAGEWGGEGDVNSRSIGIELQNTGAEPFAEPQMAALEGLLADLLRRHTLPPCAVIAHSDMAPDRKGDPGARFDWPEESPDSREARVPGNARRGQPQGKRHREETAFVRKGKGETVG